MRWEKPRKQGAQTPKNGEFFQGREKNEKTFQIACACGIIVRYVRGIRKLRKERIVYRRL